MIFNWTISDVSSMLFKEYNVIYPWSDSIISIITCILVEHKTVDEASGQNWPHTTDALVSGCVEILFKAVRASFF